MKKKFIFITVMIILIFAGLTAISYYKTDIISKIARNYPNTYTVTEEEAKSKASSFLHSLGIQEDITAIEKYNFYGINGKLRDNTYERPEKYIPVFKPWPTYFIFTEHYAVNIHGETNQVIGFSLKMGSEPNEMKTNFNPKELEEKAKEYMHLFDISQEYEFGGSIRTTQNSVMYKFNSKLHPYLGNTISKTPVTISHFEIGVNFNGTLEFGRLIWDY